MIILGIDPGLAHTGWGVIEIAGSQQRCIAYGCVTTAARDETPDRLACIYREISSVISKYTPSACAVENVYFSTNVKSAFATGQARGVALLAMADAGLELGEYSPVQIKGTVVGTGAADKSQVAYMVKASLGLDHEPAPDHASDALAVAICHARMRGGPEARKRMERALDGASR